MILRHPQLDALASVTALLEETGIDYWLFGWWAVDFYIGTITREHDDVDIAVWLDEVPRIRSMLQKDGWRHAPYPGEDGGTGYERNGVRLELTFLIGDDAGRIYVPLRKAPVQWAESVFPQDVRELLGVRSSIIPLAKLLEGKAMAREDPHDGAKDRADFAQLSRL
jgi:hypothetical protein